MKYKIGDTVIIKDDRFSDKVNNQRGVIVYINVIYNELPYQVQINNQNKVWCREHEILLYELIKCPEYLNHE